MVFVRSQDHLDELRERVLVAALAALVSVLACFAFSRDLVVFLEAPVATQGVRFLQLSPGEFFFTTLKVTSLTSPADSYWCIRQLGQSSYFEAVYFAPSRD